MESYPTQVSALNYVREKYGQTAFAVDHQNYRMVGYERGGKTISAVGQTWDEAIEALRKKRHK
jgi:SLT domain-containing protein